MKIDADDDPRRDAKPRPLISLIIATWNCAQNIDGCLQSVFEQDFPDFEVLIADGASQDDTVERIRRYSDRIAWWDSSPDSGIYDAWNRALPHVTGEWVCFIGSDDRLAAPTTLTETAIALRGLRDRSHRLAYGKVRMVNSEGRVSGELGAPAESLLWQFKHGMPKQVPHTGMFHHASLFREYGLFDPKFRIAGDYEFLLRELHGNPGSLCHLPGLVTVLKGDGGVSSDPEAIRECYRARLCNGMRGLTMFWLLVYMRSKFRQCAKKSRVHSAFTRDSNDFMDDSIKIIFCLNRALDLESGPDQKILAQVQAMGRLFSTASLVCLESRGEMILRKSDSISLKERRRSRLSRILFSISYREIIDHVAESGTDIVYWRYEHDANPFMLWFFLQLHRRGIKLYIEIPTFPYKQEKTYRKRSMFRRYVESISTRLLFLVTTRIVCFEPEDQIWRVPAIVISNGLSFSADNYLAKNAATPERSECLRLVAVASFQEWHGYDRLLTGLKQYRDRFDSGIPVSITFVGSGPALQGYKSLTAQLGLGDYVEFIPFVRGESLVRTIAGCDIGVDSLARHRSGNSSNSSLKSKEYLACGLPVIKSHSDPELDQSGYCHQVPADETPVSIEEILEWYDPERFVRPQLSEFALARFTWDIQFKKVFFER